MFFAEEVRFADGFLKFGKTHFSLESVFDFIATIANFYRGANRNNFTEYSYCYLGDYNPSHNN